MLGQVETWERTRETLPPALRPIWDEIGGTGSLRDLLSCAAGALAMDPLLWGFAIFGLPRMPRARYSEFELAQPWRPARALAWLGDILVPSLPVTAPRWCPPPLSWLLFHPTTIHRRPDHHENPSSHPHETWLFVNGVLTDEPLAQLHAAFLSDIFHRPVTLIQNATDGLIEDLAECALDKAVLRTGEAAMKAFPVVYDALADPETERVVLIAHSQGTIIASVVLRALASLPHVHLAADAARMEPVREGDIPLDLAEFEPLTLAQLGKLELYCFANCATNMTYIDAARRIPWIESFGNEHDLVARLGMLAPHPERVRIDGPRYLRRGAWGHLLNEHYLGPLDRVQKHGHLRGPHVRCAAPFALLEPEAHPDAEIPRLYSYINGGGEITPGAGPRSAPAAQSAPA